MASEWTLPLIQAELDGLPLGCDFILGPDDSQRLFGTNGPAVGRVANFASEHGCRATFRGGEFIFQKRIASGAAAPADPAAVACFPPLCLDSEPGGDDHPGPDCR